MRSLSARKSRLGSDYVDRHNTTQRFMEELGLRGMSCATGPRRNVLGSGFDTRADLIEREFAAEAPDRL